MKNSTSNPLDGGVTLRLAADPDADLIRAFLEHSPTVRQISTLSLSLATADDRVFFLWKGALTEWIKILYTSMGLKVEVIEDRPWEAGH